MSFFVTETDDPLPNLLSLHNRSQARLTDKDVAQLRESVVASSFGKGWNRIQAVYRKHPHQEVNLSASPNEHILLPVGKPILLNLRFDAGLRRPFQKARIAEESVIVIPKGMSTQWAWKPEREEEGSPQAEFLHLYLHPNALDQIAGELGISAFPLREFLGAADPVLRQFGQLFFEEIQHPRSGSRLYADSLTTALTVHLLRTYATQAFSSASGKPSPPFSPSPKLTPKRLRLVLDYIEANLHSDLSLDDLAGCAGISKYHFARLFKNATRQTPHQYLIHQRIERAKRLLKRSDQSIGEIAFALGFESHSRFAVQFRRQVGITPSAYRKG